MRFITPFAIPLALVLSGCGSNESGESATETDATSPAVTEAVAAEGAAPAVPPEAVEGASPATTEIAAAAPRIPKFDATCGDGIAVHAGRGGPVFIGGEEASLKRFNDDYFEATLNQTTVSISFNADDSISLSYTGPGRAHGICTLS